MRYRREQQYQQLNRKQNEEDCSWNSIIVWGICISVIVLIILYISFGPNLYHPPPILIGSENVSILDEDKKAIPVYESTINIDGIGNIFYRYTEPRGQGSHVQPDVLLLHGAKYASQTWKGLGTLQIFSYWGYRTIAIDLPGYKLSKKATPPPNNDDGYMSFMEAVIDKLKLTKIVIICPSISGKYGLPVLLQENQIDLRGFIAIAPQSTNKYSKQQYQSVDVPVLVMYGERDKTPYREESVYWMENIPDHTNVMIKKAQHAAFVGNPEDFHTEILRFLATQCSLGVETDTDNGYDIDYNDREGEGGGGDDYTESEYDDKNNINDDENDKNYEQYLQAIFAGDDNYNGEDYYDDTELYFDNKDLTEEQNDDNDVDQNQDIGDDDDNDNDNDDEINGDQVDEGDVDNNTYNDDEN